MREGRILEPDLAWIDGRFCEGVRIVVDPDGRIAELRPRQDPRADRGEAAPASGPAPVVRLSGRALLPGFVNAHSHAFQRALRGRTQHFPAGAGDFWSWREAMYAWVRDSSADAIRDVCRQAFTEMRAAGFTTVGEFHYLHHADPTRRDFALDQVVVEAAAEAGIRLVLISTYYATGGFDQPLEPAQRRFATPQLEAFLECADTLARRAAPSRPGLAGVAIAAHSIRAVPPEDLLALRDAARQRGWMFHMHIEEQPVEIEQCRAALGMRPMQWILEQDCVGPDFVAVHATHTPAALLETFHDRGGRLCVCPITEADLGDGIAELPATGIRPDALSIGSDSNVRIDPTEELRWLEYGQRLRLVRRGVLRDAAGRVARTLIEIGTIGGAAALGIDAGRIAPGCLADFTVVDLTHPALAGWDESTLAEAILFGAGCACICGTLVGGV